MTSIVGVCGGCGDVAPLAEAVVELDEVAAIVRCRGLHAHARDGAAGRRAETRVVFGTLREFVIARTLTPRQPSSRVIAISTGTQPIVVRNTVSREMISPTP